MSDGLNRQLLRLGTLMQLERRARRCTREELPFILVNETATLVPYRQAILWQTDGRGGGRVAASSGLAVFDAAGPYMTWIARAMRVLAAPVRPEGQGGPRIVAPADLPDDLAAEWTQWLPRSALWVPLAGPGGILLGGLLLAREEPWSEADTHLFDYLGEAYAHAWIGKEARLDRTAWMRRTRSLRRWGIGAGIALLVLAAVPVRQTALAPAEVIPDAPTIVRAPLTGVIDRVLVVPNQPVEADTVVFTLDTAELGSKLDIAAKVRDVALAEYTQAAQVAVGDPDAKARLTILEAQLAQQELEVAYLRGLLGRTSVVAGAPGVAVFENPNDWLGRPVTLGERVMVVADPARTELEIHLPAADAITLEPGTAVSFYPNATPGRSAGGQVGFVGYSASIGPDGVLAYRLKATMTGDRSADLRIGQRGTAKLYGPRSPLLVQVLRRPLTQVYQWLSP